MNLEDIFTLVQLWKVHVDDAVETPGAHQGAVQNICTVGGRHDDHVFVGAEPVHLGQELVQGIFALIVSSGEVVLATGTANGVDLIDENDTWRFFFRLFE